MTVARQFWYFRCCCIFHFETVTPCYLQITYATSHFSNMTHISSWNINNEIVGVN